ncbi:enoyl-CoA hydratase/isomerase family protein [Shewanella intestini]|uniref:3-hydroxyisobutyryl-CoA hydrolase n=1 Tax=Shewanella intestini TaxID=2017544 RepID=A0ABS5HYJ1_9GAMM|nr:MULTISPECIES: enoyl-CoA hydratase/isomerase family protein [Shewanella]MBR9726857.1 enoyl-CoA hydratase/isomerase family protein [Shewanella intestini]MRG34577.1 enoyl-CoA hydratase/isomerase family protein [Shewanella sp. XMDDZSB0408]
MTQDVIFQTLGTLSGQSVGIVTLNIEKALNALNLDMVKAMTKQLQQWQQDDNIAFVVIDASGDKAFCAGGDVRAIYHASIANPNEITQEASEFFTQEYQLDYLLHQFAKPVMVWGDGIVMGGGVGLLAGGSHRVLTERSRIAMPEVSIGLYPDVGGSYFLNRMPGKMGLFLGLTAYNMNAADGFYVGLGNHFLGHDDKEPLFDAIAEVNWSQSAPENHALLTQLLNRQQDHVSVDIGDSVLEQYQGQIDLLMAGEIEDVHHQLSSLETELSWLSRAQKTALSGSPLSWFIIFAQASLSDHKTLADCFRWELGISVNCCSHGDFCEGVRALLIDKDRQPQWTFSHASEVTPEAVTALLTSPWSAQQHPLKDM